jgi:DNA-dependent RNA polymerase auxiliary subunit epsilon
MIYKILYQRKDLNQFQVHNQCHNKVYISQKIDQSLMREI